MGQHRPARSCQAQHRRAGTTSAAAQRLPSEAGRPGQGKLSAPGPTGGGGRVAPGRGRETECPARGRGSRAPWPVGGVQRTLGLRARSRKPWPAAGSKVPLARGREAECLGPRAGSRKPPGVSRDGAPAAPGAAPRHQARRAPQRTLRSAVRRCYPPRGPAGQGRSARGSGVCRIFAGRRLCGTQIPAPLGTGAFPAPLGTGTSGASRRGCAKPVKPRPVACATVSVGGTAAS